MNRPADGGASRCGRSASGRDRRRGPGRADHGTGFAHTLELAQKLDYDAATWTQIQHTLYRYFAVIGGPLEVATIIAAVVFALRARVG